MAVCSRAARGAAMCGLSRPHYEPRRAPPLEKSNEGRIEPRSGSTSKPRVHTRGFKRRNININPVGVGVLCATPMGLFVCGAVSLGSAKRNPGL